MMKKENFSFDGVLVTEFNNLKNNVGDSCKKKIIENDLLLDEISRAKKLIEKEKKQKRPWEENLHKLLQEALNLQTKTFKIKYSPEKVDIIKKIGKEIDNISNLIKKPPLEEEKNNILANYDLLFSEIDQKLSQLALNQISIKQNSPQQKISDVELNQKSPSTKDSSSKKDHNQDSDKRELLQGNFKLTLFGKSANDKQFTDSRFKRVVFFIS